MINNLSELNFDIQNYESSNLIRRQLFRENDSCTENTIEVYSQNDNKIQNNSENTSLCIYIHIFIYMKLLLYT